MAIHSTHRNVNGLLQSWNFHEFNWFGVRRRVPYPLLRQVGYSWLPLTRLNHHRQLLTDGALAGQDGGQGKEDQEPPRLEP